MMLQGKHLREDRIHFHVDALIADSLQYASDCIPADHCKSKVFIFRYTESLLPNLYSKIRNINTYVYVQEYLSELKKHMFTKTLSELKLDDYKCIGYTYKTLGAGFWALKQDDFRQALQDIVMAVRRKHSAQLHVHFYSSC